MVTQFASDYSFFLKIILDTSVKNVVRSDYRDRISPTNFIEFFNKLPETRRYVFLVYYYKAVTFVFLLSD